MAIPRRLTHLLLSPIYFLTRPISSNSVEYSTYSPDLYHLIYYFLFSSTFWLNFFYIKFEKTQKKTKQFKDTEKEKKTANNKMQKIVSMESPSGIQGRHVDPAHFGETSHEEPVLSGRTQKWDLLPRIVSGTQQWDWKSPISKAI